MLFSVLNLTPPLLILYVDIQFISFIHRYIRTLLFIYIGYQSYIPHLIVCSCRHTRINIIRIRIDSYIRLCRILSFNIVRLLDSYGLIFCISFLYTALIYSYHSARYLCSLRRVLDSLAFVILCGFCFDSLFRLNI